MEEEAEEEEATEEEEHGGKQKNGGRGEGGQREHQARASDVALHFDVRVVTRMLRRCTRCYVYMYTSVRAYHMHTDVNPLFPFTDYKYTVHETKNTSLQYKCT